MTGAERGFLLLTCHFGDPNRSVLTVSQFRILAQRMKAFQKTDLRRELLASDLINLGYREDKASHILSLLEESDRLEYYIRSGIQLGCTPLTRITREYPDLLCKRLGWESPGVLWARGNISLLEKPMISLVGSRELRSKNRNFARKVGMEAARQGYVLVSGNARGADRAAQDSCLSAGGSVISVVADRLIAHVPRENVLYLSEDGYNDDFSAFRALSRNRVIHCLGSRTFVAQTDLQQGGTWDGTTKNLRFRWSPVFGFEDGSPGMQELRERGAELIGLERLESFYDLEPKQIDLFNR